MSASPDFSSYSHYPRIRADLIIVPQVVQGIQTFMIKNPTTRTYLRVGELEHTVMNFLDGQTPFSQIQAQYEQSTGWPLEAKDLEGVLKCLKDADLLERSRKEKSVLFYQKMKERRRKKLKRRLGLKNILELSVPAFDPDRFFNRIVSPLRFCWTKGFVIATLVTLFLGVLMAATNWNAFLDAAFSLYSFEGKTVIDFILIYSLFFITVAIHECAHGLTCKHYGGEVHELGFILYYFQPCFYCSVDDSYLFDSKYKRMTVMIAGVYSEMVVCTLAVFIWWLTPTHILLHKLAAYTIAVTGLIAVIFNFNPLMKYDGYYILSDYLEVLNLREESFKYIGDWLKKLLLRMSVEPEDVSSRDKRIYLIYGVSALVYSVFVLFVFFLMVKNFMVGTFHIWGILALLFLVYVFFKRKVKQVWNALKEFEKNRKMIFYVKKHPLFLSLVFLLATYVLFFMKIDWTIQKNCFIEPNNKFEVRSTIPGFIRQVLIREGDNVVQNQPLVVMENDSMRSLVARLRIELGILTHNTRLSAMGNDIALFRANETERRRLESELNNAEKRLKGLVVLAPADGQVLTSNLQERKGVFVDVGDEICQIANLSELKARIRLAQWEIGDVKENDRVELRFPSFPHPQWAMIALLSVTPQGSSLSDFEAQVDFKSPSQLLKPGMSGEAKIRCEEVSLVSYCFRRIYRSVRAELWK